MVPAEGVSRASADGSRIAPLAVWVWAWRPRSDEVPPRRRSLGSPSVRMLIAAFASASRSMPQSLQRNRLPRREAASTLPHVEQVLEVLRGLTATISTPYWRHLSAKRRRIVAGADRSSARLRPVLALTPMPGSSRVPRAERTMFATCRSSTTIRSAMLTS